MIRHTQQGIIQGTSTCLLRTLFHKTVHLMKDVIWSKKKEEKPWKRQLAVKLQLVFLLECLAHTILKRSAGARGVYRLSLMDKRQHSEQPSMFYQEY